MEGYLPTSYVTLQIPAMSIYPNSKVMNYVLCSAKEITVRSKNEMSIFSFGAPTESAF